MTISETILATLAYHDIFDYPLTSEEIQKYLVEKKATFASVKNGIDQLVRERKVGSLDGYFFLKGRKKIVALRKKRQKYSKTKLKKAFFFAKILKAVPTLKLVAVSGALAMENSHKDDDIDLVLISAKRTIWATRFFANVLLLAFKRDPKGEKVSNRACLNVFIDESSLKIQPPNLYLAHEICQMKPLWDREGTYQKFLKANNWVKNFLPNWKPTQVESPRPRQATRPRPDEIGKRGGQSRKLKVISSLITHNSSLVERLLRSFQLWYMRPKITTEKIGDTQLFFHPAGTMDSVLETYRGKLKKLGLD
jgi:hypothetical protein